MVPSCGIVFDIDGVLVHGTQFATHRESSVQPIASGLVGWVCRAAERRHPTGRERTGPSRPPCRDLNIQSCCCPAWRQTLARVSIPLIRAGPVTGPKAVPGAREALQRVVAANIPHVFVTNNGMEDEQARSLRLQGVLDLEIDPARMILCQTPLKVRVLRLLSRLGGGKGTTHTAGKRQETGRGGELRRAAGAGYWHKLASRGLCGAAQWWAPVPRGV